MAKLLYKPFGALIGALGGLIAGALFKRLWGALARDPSPPEATQAGRSWAEVLAAAVIEGAVYAGVKATLERGGAVAFARATGAWPGDPPEG